MKKLFLLLILSVAGASASAQVVVNGTDINALDIQFCHLYCERSTVLTNANAWIDYGQRFTQSTTDRFLVRDTDGRPRRWNSPTEALNFMVANGWELVSWQLTHTQSGTDDTFVYLLRRRRDTERLP